MLRGSGSGAAASPPVAEGRRASARAVPRRAQASGAARCRRKFLRFFPGGFRDETYVDWERAYKAGAHAALSAALEADAFRALLRAGEHRAIADAALRIEGRTNLLYSFEKMALRDAVRPARGAKAFALGLWNLLHGSGDGAERFDRWCDVLAGLPRPGRRVLTWPVATVFPFLAAPRRHVFLKPVVTRRAAAAYGFPFDYESRPRFLPTYASLLSFAATVRRDLRDLRPRDMIDVQSFVWVQGSDEY
jgi:hypothetical protein